MTRRGRRRPSSSVTLRPDVPKPLLVDTNLLVLLVVGETNKTYIAGHKRTKAYEIEDFLWLRNLAKASGGLVFCPHVIAETSNLARDHWAADAIGETMRALLGAYPEVYLSSRAAAADQSFTRLGATDAVLLRLAQTDGQLITDDLGLALAAGKVGADVINYNYIRAARVEGN